jgi:hypothetical protein
MCRVGICTAIVVAVAVSGNAQEKAPKKESSLASVLHNDRLKVNALKDSPIVGGTNDRVAEGVWLPESGDPSKNLVFPQQAKIYCTRHNKSCREINVTIGAGPGLVAINELDDEEYDVDSWDTHGLVASYGGDDISGSPCQRHVLTMEFESGAVSLSDIPTHRKGCDSIKETDSYKLVRGFYYVDTSPGNNMDKSNK